MSENSIPDPLDEDKKESKWDNTPIFLDESVDIPSKKKDIPPPKTTRVTPLIAGLAMCCVLFTIGIAFLSPNLFTARRLLTATALYTSTPRAASTLTATPTRIPTVTLTPYALIPAVGNIEVFNETYDSNANRWGSFYDENTTIIQDGKLYLKSNRSGYVGVAVCNGCPAYDEGFYFQAEVLPEKRYYSEHGIVFCSDSTAFTHYVFAINSASQRYSVYKKLPSEWKTVSQNTLSEAINKYPVSNTLAVEYEQGRMKLYINGSFVTTHRDPEQPLACGMFGIYIDDGHVNIIADNVFAYEIK